MSQRKYPSITFGLYEWQRDQLVAFHERSGMSRSRIVREIISFALNRGYIPGRFSLGRKDESIPDVTVTIHRWQDERIDKLHKDSDLSQARILREIFSFSLQRGYRPGQVSIADMSAEAREQVNGQAVTDP